MPQALSEGSLTPHFGIRCDDKLRIQARASKAWMSVIHDRKNLDPIVT